MINKDKLKRRFSRNAKQYDQYAHVQKIMGDHLIQQIHHDGPLTSILEIGCGTGYVTSQLAQLFPQAEITAIDIAPGMIDYAKSHIKSEIQWLCADIETFPLDKSYDLILSNATFQWFNHFDDTFKKLVTALTPSGQLSFSTFGDTTFHELRSAFDAISQKRNLEHPLQPSQRFFKQTELMNTCRSVLNTCNGSFKLIPKDALEQEFFPSCQEFLMAVKKIGANNAQQNRNPLIPGFIEEVMAHYDLHHQTDKGVQATYHTLYMNITKTL